VSSTCNNILVNAHEHKQRFAPMAAGGTNYL